MMENKRKENVKIQKCIFENVYRHKMYLRIYYDMKFILLCP